MNFTDIKGKPCRIMWSQRDPSLRKSGVGNIFVKNLAPSVDNKGLYDVFSVFGNILSCKITTDENGISKGYGYVHYETAEAANEAIQKVNGMILEEQEVVVGHFLRRQDRSTNEWTNLYVKQFSPAWTEENIAALFSPFGELSSVKVARDENGVSKAFAFVDFTNHESAAKALNELQGKVVEGPGSDGQPAMFELYVNRAQKKAERLREIKSRTDSAKAEQLGKYQGMNLYVKNIDDTLTDDQLRELFAPFGTITSARIMKEDESNVSKGFGFVCYSSPEEASRAVAEMNGKMIGNKPLYVTLHQRKEIRRAQLAAAHARMPRFPMGQSPQMPFPMYGGPGQPPMPPRQFPMMPPMMPPRGPGRGGVPPYGFPGGRGGYPLPTYAMGMPMGPGGPMQGPNNPGFKRGGPAPPVAGRRMPGPPGPGVPPGGRGGMGIPPRGYPPQQPMRPGVPAPNVKYTNQVRNPPMQMGGPPMGHPMHQPQQAPPMPRNSDGLDHNALAQADFTTQKNMIGEKLYPLVLQHQPSQAGKITGMLLEMDNAELLHLLESPEALQSKVHEAMTVLQQHTQGL